MSEFTTRELAIFAVHDALSFMSSFEGEPMAFDSDSPEAGEKRAREMEEGLEHALEHLEAGAHEDLHREVAKRLPKGTRVEVTTWEGCDEENWHDPVYVTAYDPHEGVAYFDAVCDLGAGSIVPQAEFVTEQLENG